MEAGDDFSQCVTMDQVEVGKTYELIITNMCGFYRYRMSDAFWLQPQSTFFWRDMQILKGKSAGQLKPVKTIANEDQRKFFFILRER